MLNTTGLIVAIEKIYRATWRLFRCNKVSLDLTPEQETTEYIRQLWRFQQVVKDNLLSLYEESRLLDEICQPPTNLPSNEAESCITAIVSECLVYPIELPVGQQSQARLLARPQCVLVLSRIRQSAVATVAEEEFHVLVEAANSETDQILRELLFERLLEKIGASSPASQLQHGPQPRQLVFALFLLLGRMVRFECALRLKQTDEGQYELQKELVDALNRLGEEFFQDGWGPRIRFKLDKFSRELQRRGTLLSLFDDRLRWRQDPQRAERYYFEVGDYEVDLSALRFVVSRLIFYLSKFNIGPEEAQTRLEALRRKYIIEFPLRSVERDQLQREKPEIEPYSTALQRAIQEATQEQAVMVGTSSSGHQLRLGFGASGSDSVDE